MRTVKELRELENAGGEESIVALKLLELHDFACSRPSGTFLELGTDRGQATNVILEACRGNGGRLVSVDVLDCSGAASGKEWQFIQCSSIARETILGEAGFLSSGIDMVYVDSKHTPDHVMAEINTWMPLLKVGGRMYFDDVDSGPYLRDARKDNALTEIANRAIFGVVLAYFRKNVDCLRMTMLFGSTGLAWLDKRRVGECRPLQGREIPSERRLALLYQLLIKLGLYKPYRHRRDGSDLLVE